MANSFTQMILNAFPDATPGEDFTIKSDSEGHPELDYWNTEKLGNEPNITALHSDYMKQLKRRKEIIPATDDSDPAPWLNADYKTPKDKENLQAQIRYLQTVNNNATEVPRVQIDPDTGMVYTAKRNLNR